MNEILIDACKTIRKWFDEGAFDGCDLPLADILSDKMFDSLDDNDCEWLQDNWTKYA